jgi:hypothetical protein
LCGTSRLRAEEVLELGVNGRDVARTEVVVGEEIFKGAGIDEEGGHEAADRTHVNNQAMEDPADGAEAPSPTIAIVGGTRVGEQANMGKMRLLPLPGARGGGVAKDSPINEGMVFREVTTTTQGITPPDQTSGPSTAEISLVPLPGITRDDDTSRGIKEGGDVGTQEAVIGSVKRGMAFSTSRQQALPHKRTEVVCKVRQVGRGQGDQVAANLDPDLPTDRWSSGRIGGGGQKGSKPRLWIPLTRSVIEDPKRGVEGGTGVVNRVTRSGR